MKYTIKQFAEMFSVSEHTILYRYRASALQA